MNRVRCREVDGVQASLVVLGWPGCSNKGLVFLLLNPPAPRARSVEFTALRVLGGVFIDGETHGDGTAKTGQTTDIGESEASAAAWKQS